MNRIEKFMMLVGVVFLGSSLYSTLTHIGEGAGTQDLIIGLLVGLVAESSCLARRVKRLSEKAGLE